MVDLNLAIGTFGLALIFGAIHPSVKGLLSLALTLGGMIMIVLSATTEITVNAGLVWQMPVDIVAALAFFVTGAVVIGQLLLTYRRSRAR